MSEAQPSVDQILGALKNCYDPEIPVNIVDLGLIYDVKNNLGDVYIKMTLTARGCPAHTTISENVKAEVMKLPGVKNTQVEVVWDPPWSPEKMSEEAKKQLGYSEQQPTAGPQISIGSDMKPIKMGKSVNRTDGTLVLMNEKDQSFKVSQEVVTFWEMCEGTKSIAELTDEIATKISSDVNELKPQVMELVTKLVESELVKV